MEELMKTYGDRVVNDASQIGWQQKRFNGLMGNKGIEEKKKSDATGLLCVDHAWHAWYVVCAWSCTMYMM